MDIFGVVGRETYCIARLSGTKNHTVPRVTTPSTFIDQDMLARRIARFYISRETADRGEMEINIARLSPYWVLLVIGSLVKGRVSLFFDKHVSSKSVVFNYTARAFFLRWRFFSFFLPASSRIVLPMIDRSAPPTSAEATLLFFQPRRCLSSGQLVSYAARVCCKLAAQMTSLLSALLQKISLQMPCKCRLLAVGLDFVQLDCSSSLWKLRSFNVDEIENS